MKTLLITAALLLAAPVSAEVVTRDISYQVGANEFTGYYGYDDTLEGPRPGILVVHEWWGHTPYVRERVEMLAELGYAAFALDMYGTGKVTDHPDHAKAFMMAVLAEPEGAEQRFDKATQLLRQQPEVDSDQIAAIGYCFGGGIVLEMARAGKNLKGVVSFHGSLATDNPAQPGQVKARVLVYNGQADTMIPADQVQAFQEEMNAANADWFLVNFAGVKHSFTNPDADDLATKHGLPLAYSPMADRHSWIGMQTFFDSIFN